MTSLDPTKLYLGSTGITDLAKTLSGKERIFLGIRPFGFHAGNALTLIAYPYLLCEAIQSAGRLPAFNFFYSINDWEPDVPFGPDRAALPLNIWPKHTSLQFTRSEEDPEEFVADYWQPIIERHVSQLKKYFPKISINFIRNSELKISREFSFLLPATIVRAAELAKTMGDEGGCKRLLGDTDYAGAVCPLCRSTTGRTNIDTEGVIFYTCLSCFNVSKGAYSDFEYWWHHKPMWLARIMHLKIDLSISGGDHYSEGDYKMRHAIARFFGKESVLPKMLFSPTLLSTDGARMSKTKGNVLFAKISALIERARSVDSESFSIQKSEYYEEPTDPKDYFSSF